MLGCCQCATPSKVNQRGSIEEGSPKVGHPKRALFGLFNFSEVKHKAQPKFSFWFCFRFGFVFVLVLF